MDGDCLQTVCCESSSADSSAPRRILFLWHTEFDSFLGMPRVSPGQPQESDCGETGESVARTQSRQVVLGAGDGVRGDVCGSDTRERSRQTDGIAPGSTHTGFFRSTDAECMT